MEGKVPLGYAAALLASALFGWAIVPSRGHYSDSAFALVALGTLVVAWRYAASFGRREPQLPARLVAGAALATCLAMVIVALTDRRPLLYAEHPWSAGRQAQVVLLLALAAYGPSAVRWREPRRARHARFALVAGCVLLAGVDAVLVSPAPDIDVWTVQQEGARAFLDGKNPFVEVHKRDTGPRTAEDVPYVYPPLHLYLTAPSWRLLGDVRYAMLGALLLLGVALRALAGRFGARALPAILEDGPALFVWCTPKLFFLLEQGWVDPVQVAWCSALVLVATLERPWATAALAGLVVSAKQTMLLVAGLVGLGQRFSWRQWAVAAAVSLATFVPWLLWDFDAWRHANLGFLSALPVRPDALTFTTCASKHLGLELPTPLAFVLAFALAGLFVWKGRRTPGAITLACAAVMTAFFVFNKWAFANYYFTLLGLCAIAAAAALKRDEAQQAVSAAAPPP